MDLICQNRARLHNTVPPGFCDSAIAEFIAKSSKLRNFRKSSQIFIIAADFPQILGLDATRDVIATHIQSKKGCSSTRKPFILIMPDLQELHWTNEPKAELIHATRRLLTITRHRYTQRWEIQ